MPGEAVHLAEVAGRDHLGAGVGEHPRRVLSSPPQRVVLEVTMAVEGNVRSRTEPSGAKSGESLQAPPP